MTQTTITPAEATDLNQACIADKLRLLNRVITHIYDGALHPIGITTSQMNILVVVAKYGEATLRQVGDWLHLEKSTLSRNVNRLQKNGWLAVTFPTRGRTHRLKLSVEGHRTLNKGLPLWEAAQSRARTLLGENGIKEVMQMAETVRS